MPPKPRATAGTTPKPPQAASPAVAQRPVAHRAATAFDDPNHEAGRPASAGQPGAQAAEPAAAATPPGPARTASATLAAARPPAAATPSSRPSKPGSLRPPPPPRRSTRPPSRPPLEGLEGFDEGSIAHAFDALLSEGSVGVAGTAVADLAPVRELFAELAANHMRHVRDFMIDVKWGEAPREWIEICVPAVASLRRAAERLDLAELAVALDGFREELEVARAAEGPRSEGHAPRSSISGETKDKLLESYQKLVTVLPQAFALDRDKSQREAVIIQSLLLSIPDVRKVTIDKLHGAGLTSLKTLFDAQADEIAQVAGIPEALAQRIVERFEAYRQELANASPQDARAAERERLATLTMQLKEQHDGYEEAARGWTADAKAKKRDLFRAREETWLAISLLLARFGEVERLQGIEKVPFAQRIAQLTEYLEEARDRYRLET